MNNGETYNQNTSVNENNEKFIKKISLLLGLIVFLVGSIVVLDYLKPKVNPNFNSTNKVSNSKPTPNTKEGWDHFKHDVLGIEFDYPKSWGEPETKPFENITNLQTINKDFLNLDYYIDYRYMVKIRFSKNDDIKMDFINNEFPGENYHIDDGRQYGPIDNFNYLIKTRNICDYQILFDHRPKYDGTLIEKYNDCSDNIKTTLLFDDPNRNYYNYSFKQYFFTKLNNGYFDNLLVKYYIAGTQDHSQYLTYKDILNNSNSKVDYSESMSNFKEFVNSINTFKPPTPTSVTFSTIPNEDPNVTIIRQYYFFLATQNLPDAYNMYQNKTINFEEFSKWYEQVFNTKVYAIKQVDQNTYKFDIDLFEHNQPIAKYRVLMEVKNNKINTLSSEQIRGEEVKFKNLLVYARLKLNRNEIVLIKDGKEIVIDSADNDWDNKPLTTSSYHDPQFSSNGNYLIYTKSGWEWFFKVIYDINKEQKIKLDLLNYEFVVFTNDEKNLIACASSRMAGEESAKIYSVPSFNLKMDFAKDHDYYFSDCQYSPTDSKLKVIIKNDQDETIEVIDYDLNKDQIIE